MAELSYVQQMFHMCRERHILNTGECFEEINYGLTSWSSQKANAERLPVLKRGYSVLENLNHRALKDLCCEAVVTRFAIKHPQPHLKKISLPGLQVRRARRCAVTEFDGTSPA